MEREMNEKEKFLKKIIFSNSWDKAIHHRAGGKLYAENVSKKQKEEFYKSDSFKDIVKFIEDDILPKYKERMISDEEHFTNIKTLQKKLKALNENYKSEISGKNKLDDVTDIFDMNGAIVKIATAQKLLNLMCKYWWVEGWINEPPHCPIDGIVSDKGKLEINWTSDLEDDETEYAKSKYGKAMEKLKEVAKDAIKPPVAQWELKIWNETKTGEYEDETE